MILLKKIPFEGLIMHLHDISFFFQYRACVLHFQFGRDIHDIWRSVLHPTWQEASPLTSPNFSLSEHFGSYLTALLRSQMGNSAKFMGMGVVPNMGVVELAVELSHSSKLDNVTGIL
jgi:hypothetical protein